MKQNKLVKRLQKEIGSYDGLKTTVKNTEQSQFEDDFLKDKTGQKLREMYENATSQSPPL